MANILVHNNMATITTIKSFIVLALGGWLEGVGWGEMNPVKINDMLSHSMFAVLNDEVCLNEGSLLSQLRLIWQGLL